MASLLNRHNKELNDANAKLFDLNAELDFLKEKYANHEYPGPDHTKETEMEFIEVWGIFRGNEMHTWCSTKDEAEGVMRERWYALQYINGHQHLYKIRVMTDTRELKEESVRFAGKYSGYVKWKTHYNGNVPMYMTPYFDPFYMCSYMAPVTLIKHKDGKVINPWNGWEITEVK